MAARYETKRQGPLLTADLGHGRPGVVRSKAARVVLPLATVVLIALGFTACVPGLEISIDPAVFPGFNQGVFDYVNRCDPSSPTDVSVTAPGGTKVSVAGQSARSGTFTTSVDQAVGKRFTIDVTTGGATTTYSVRCLPTDFPQFSASRTGTPQAQFYSTVLIQSFGTPAYAVVFDTNGVPVWWLRNKVNALLWTRLANGNFATDLVDGPMQEYDLNGTKTRELATVGGPSDFHDVVVLPNGNYVLAAAQVQACNLTAWARPADSRCINHVFQELTPQGSVVWSWDTAAHIPVTETTATWRNDTLNSQNPFDPWHFNSVESTGDGFIISFRHLDAIYKINKATGAIVWKLGGTARTQSLSVVGDPVFSAGGSFSGQHDARLLSNGVVTLHDNGSKIRAPRAVAYRIDEAQHTATFVEQVTDSRYPSSGCCGSSRRLPGGDWVNGWGQTNAITEQRSDGQPVLTITHSGFVYRGLPITSGLVDITALRSGMDSQYPK
jgi:hypothetical protein